MLSHSGEVGRPHRTEKVIVLMIRVVDEVLIVRVLQLGLEASEAPASRSKNLAADVDISLSKPRSRKIQIAKKRAK